VQTPGRDPRNRTDHSYGHSGSHWQRCSLQEGARIFCLARRGARRTLYGGKQKLTGTSRRGNKYLRKLFVQGAHTVLLQKTKQSSGLSTWLVNLTSRKRKQVATVALANKMARMVWAVLFKGEAYRPPTAPPVIAA
jgi:hypothetical protein